MTKEFKYTIGERMFIQRPLVWGQVRQLMDLLKTVEIKPPYGTKELVEVLGDKIIYAVAIALSEQGKSPKEKDVTSLVTDIEFDLSVDMMLQVIDDFFSCNPTALYLERLSKLIGNVAKGVEETAQKIGSIE